MSTLPVHAHVYLDGYEFSLVTDTNSTVSGIPGPGRTMDALLQKAGRRLERTIVGFSERQGNDLDPLRRSQFHYAAA
jgi:hypothetical protein